MVMPEVSASEFKTHCLRLMEYVRQKRESLIITKRGKPVAKLVPIEEEAKEIFGAMRGRLEIVGDIVSPAVPTDAWAVMNDTSGENQR